MADKKPYYGAFSGPDIDRILASVASKANASDVEALAENVAEKASGSDLNAVIARTDDLEEVVSTKADVSDVEAVSENVNALSEAVSTKANASDVGVLAEMLRGLETVVNDMVLASTGDTTDRTSEIEAKLQNERKCVLGPGEFYTTGITIPAGTSLFGSGKDTVIVLDDSVTEGAAIKLSTDTIVSNLTITGGENTITSTIGTRHGILWKGTGTSGTSPKNGSVSECKITNFNGGGITCESTSTGTVNFIHAKNCYIENCNAGINIQQSSEFNKFVNIRTFACWYSCVNQSGNNLFMHCDFSRSKVGFYIKNTGSYPNNGHGSAVGCIFNHMNDNSGNAVEITETSNGFVFVGCQIFFGDIVIKNAKGIIFESCIFGNGKTIKVTQDSLKVNGVVQFANCTFGNRPAVLYSKNTMFCNCFTRDGDRVGNKNLMSTESDSSDGTQNWLDIPVDLVAGDYAILFGTLTSNDTDAEKCRGIFLTSDYQNASVYFMFDRGTNVSAEVSVTAKASILRINPSTTISYSAGDTVSFEKGMICTAADWALSHEYRPYEPSMNELYEMVKNFQTS
jgi:hypothetical protein